MLKCCSHFSVRRNDFKSCTQLGDFLKMIFTSFTVDELDQTKRKLTMTSQFNQGELFAKSFDSLCIQWQPMCVWVCARRLARHLIERCEQGQQYQPKTMNTHLILIHNLIFQFCILSQHLLCKRCSSSWYKLAYNNSQLQWNAAGPIGLLNACKCNYKKKYIKRENNKTKLSKNS